MWKMSFQYSARGLKHTTSSPIITRPGLLVYGYNLVPTFIAQKVSSSVGNRLTHLKAGRSLAVMKSFTYLLALSLEHTFFVFRLSKWLNFRTKKLELEFVWKKNRRLAPKCLWTSHSFRSRQRNHWAIAAVWPDVGIKRSQIFSKVAQEVRKCLR